MHNKKYIKKQLIPLEHFRCSFGSHVFPWLLIPTHFTKYNDPFFVSLSALICGQKWKKQTIIQPEMGRYQQQRKYQYKKNLTSSTSYEACFCQAPPRLGGVRFGPPSAPRGFRAVIWTNFPRRDIFLPVKFMQIYSFKPCYYH